MALRRRTRNLLWALIFLLVFIAGAIWFAGSVRDDAALDEDGIELRDDVEAEDVPEGPAELN